MSAPPLVAVVDDDPSVLRALRRLLRVAGYAVETFVSGADLLRWPALPTIACLVLDVNMAGLSGFQVQELLDRRLAIPIVFMTAQDDVPTRQRALRGGEARYLPKPFDDQTLIAEIQRAMAGAGGAGRAAGIDQRTV
jgi:FixJ family two-component response regulator